MLDFSKVEQLLAEKGVSKMTLRHRYGININQLNRYIDEGYSGGIIDKLCAALDCQPSDFIQHVKDRPKND